MGRSTRYSSEVRERAVGMVLEHRDEYESQWASLTSIASKTGYASGLFSACLPGLPSSIPPANALAATLVSPSRTWVASALEGLLCLKGRGPFAVGTALTGGPPHRSQRALLTHWAPTSGHDAQSLFGIRVQCSMLDDFHQPSVVDGIEESTDVRVEYPVHFLVNRAPLSRQATCRIRSSAFRRSGDRT